MGQLTHQEIEELLGAYALDAVDPDEAELVGLHLPTCPRCRAEVAEHREVAAVLAYAGSPAPPGLWSRIAGSLEEAPPQLDLARVTALRRPPPRRSFPVRAVAAMSAVAAAVIAVLGFQVVRQEQRIDDLASAVQEQGLDEALRGALFADGSRRVAMRSDDGLVRVNAVLGSNGEAYLVDDTLPELSDDQTYQLWGLVDQRLVSLGLLGADPGVSAFKVHGDVTLLAVTAEEAGGVVASKNAPVVKGSVPA